MLVNLQVFDLLLSKQNHIKCCPTSGDLVSTSVPTASAWVTSCHTPMGTMRQYIGDVLGEDQRGPPSSRSLEVPWWMNDPVDPWYLYEEEPGGWVDIDGITPSAPTANTPLTFGATTTRGRDYPKVARTHDGSWNISLTFMQDSFMLESMNVSF